MAKYWLGLGLTLGALLPSLAVAQTPAPAPAESCVAPGSEDTESAKQAFRDGQSAFSEGDYQRAAERWQSAYDLDCTAHALLLNLAMAQELLGRPDMSARTLQLFNARAPDSPYVAANQKRIVRLERTAVSPIRPRREAQRPCPTTPLAPASVHNSPGVSLPLALALGGGLAAVLGGAFYAEARVSASNASDACGGPPAECSSRNAVSFGERARARAEASGWITSIGVATLAGGVVWELLSSKRSATPHSGSAAPLRLGSRLAGDGAGLELAGGF